MNIIVPDVNVALSILNALISPDDSPLPPLIPQTPPPPTLESIESPAATPLLQTEGGLRQTEGGLWQIMLLLAILLKFTIV